MIGELVIFTFGISFLVPWIYKTKTLRRIRKDIKLGKEYDERTLKKKLAGPEWSIADRFQNIMKPVFICLFYCSAVPFIIILTFIIVTANYWMDKTSLLRRFKRPPAYDDKVPYVMITYILPWAVVFHLAVGTVLYYQKEGNSPTWIAFMLTLVVIFTLSLLGVLRNFASLCRLATTPYNRNNVKKIEVQGNRSYSEIGDIDSYKRSYESKLFFEDNISNLRIGYEF
jgi:hypothetical protein